MSHWNSQKGSKPSNLQLFNKDSNTGVCCGYCEIFIKGLRWLLLIVLAVNSATLGSFVPPRAFDFDQKLTQNVAQMTIYYQVTKQFIGCLNWLIPCFPCQNVFWKNISCFRFWWKTYTKHCTNNCVISRVKRLSSPALCVDQVFLISRYDSENRKIMYKQKYWIKTMAVKIPILILFRFCLLWWVSSVSIVAVSWFSSIGPCRWFSSL